MTIQHPGDQHNETSSRIFVDGVATSEISVLVVDDDPDTLDLTATFLAREQGKFDVVTREGARDALAYLNQSTEAVEAIVSDYEMPGMDGLEFLKKVREEIGSIPFILFTGKGSEEIASEAISRGVTDYLQKEVGSAQYSVLANRLVNSVENYRAQCALEQSEEKFSKMVLNSTDFISIVSEDGHFEYVSPSSDSIIDYDNEEMIGDSVFSYVHPDDRQEVMEQFFAAVEEPGMEPTVQFRLNDTNGDRTVVESRGRNLLDDDVIEGFVVNTRDITALKEREWELRERNKKLEDVQRALSHDIKNPLSVASDSVALYRETGQEQYLEKIERSIERIDSLIEQVLKMAECQTGIEDTETVSLRQSASSAWEMIDAEGGELHIQNSRKLEAEPVSLQQVFENLFENAIEHSRESVTISAGATESAIYVEDTGPGIPEENRDRIFDSGYTTDTEGTGFGLTIVEQIVAGHGWEIEVTDREDGGARFEITGVTFQPDVYE